MQQDDENSFSGSLCAEWVSVPIAIVYFRVKVGVKELEHLVSAFKSSTLSFHIVHLGCALGIWCST
jgi:hypothetical protein